MDGNGNQVITALYRPGFACPGGTTNDYTSAHINANGKFEHTYDRYGRTGLHERLGLLAHSDVTAGLRYRDTDCHIFAMGWDVNGFRFHVDDALCGTVSSSNIPAGTTWIFNSPKHIDILYDFAIGGPWPGNPGSTSVWPQKDGHRLSSGL